MSSVLYLGTFLLCFSLKAFGEICCQNKKVGQYNYIYAGQFDLASSYDCLNNCSYTRYPEEYPTKRYCFAYGDLKVECLDDMPADNNGLIRDIIDWHFNMKPVVGYIRAGEAVTFKWISGHNVNIVDESVYNSCIGIPNTTPSTRPYTYTGPLCTLPSTTYFVCGVGNGTHCNSGMKAQIACIPF